MAPTSPRKKRKYSDDNRSSIKSSRNGSNSSSDGEDDDDDNDDDDDDDDVDNDDNDDDDDDDDGFKSDGDNDVTGNDDDDDHDHDREVNNDGISPSQKKRNKFNKLNIDLVMTMAGIKSYLNISWKKNHNLKMNYDIQIIDTQNKKVNNFVYISNYQFFYLSIYRTIIFILYI
jgi:hypothetical protein